MIPTVEELLADRQELIEALSAMVSRYASVDRWEVPLECDVRARAVLEKHGAIIYPETGAILVPAKK